MKQLKGPTIFDIDGILADWCFGFTELARKIVGFNGPATTTAQQLYWEDLGGLSEPEINACWRWVDENPMWWNSLPTMPLTEGERQALIRYECTHPCYFVTSRRDFEGHTAHWTQRWLEDRFDLDNPHVICSKRKGDLAKALNATFLLDDKCGNVLYTTWASPQTKAYLLDRPYNQLDSRGIGSTPPLRVKTLGEFLEIITNA